MTDNLSFGVAVMFAKQLDNAAATLIRVMRDLGATMMSYSSVSVPIEMGIESPNVFGYNDEVSFQGVGWSGTVGLAPYSSIGLRWESDAGTWSVVNAVFEHLMTLGGIEFAACEQTQDLEHDYPREQLLLYFLPQVYVKYGPYALGARTLLGTRLLSLFGPDVRDALVAAGRLGAGGLDLGDETWLTTEEGRARRRRLATAFEASGVAPSFNAGWRGVPEMRPGPAWVPPRPGRGPTKLTKTAADAIKALKKKGASSLELPGLEAPFANLSSLDVLEIELEGAKLPCTSLDGALLHDVGAVEVDLRGAYAARSRWLESSLHGADLRYANFTGAVFPVTRLDSVNAAYATFTDAGIVESAVDACFDHVTALRWNPSDTSWAPRLTNSTFRHAVLNAAHFDRVKLDGAVFDGADLTNVKFTAARLHGVSFRGAILTGTTFTGCDLDGAIFDDGVAPAIR